jgi:hypothetical protein
MNPYLEQEDVWQDFHQSFLIHARELLTGQVRPHYVVKVEELVFIHELPGEERRLLGQPDVSVIDRPRPAADGPHALQAPTTVWIPPGAVVEHHSYLEIRDRSNRGVVTVLELLSPSNKRPGADREQYLSKRRRLLRSPTHLVEIDLLRGGPRLPVEGLAPCDYYALVSRAEQRPSAGLWPIRLRDPLPTIPVPLRSGDADASIDLQAALHRIYDAAGYEDYIYTGAPEPPLPAEDAAWAGQLVPHPPTGG